MRLVVLGSGTCLGSLPGAAARMPPLFALDAGEADDPLWILFDCSEGARWRLPAAGIDARAIRHVAVSHPHADHAALPQFLQGRSCEAIYRAGAALELALYLPDASAAALSSLLAWHQPEDGGALPKRYPFRLVPIADGFRSEIAAGVVLAAHAVLHGHGRSPAVAFRVETPRGTFAYSGDTGPCEGVVGAARGADLFVCEAAARVGQDMSDYGHLNPRQAGDVALRAGARRLVLTHHTGLDPDDAMLDDARASGFPGEIVVANDGLELAIP